MSVLSLGKAPSVFQELALYLDMTIRETLMYFGRLHKMSRSHLTERIKCLLELLLLPDDSQRIRKLR